MRYYVKNPHNGQVEGPIEAHELNARIEEQSIGPDWLATSDIGDALERLKQAPDRDWFSLARIPDVRIAHPKILERKKVVPQIISFSTAVVLMAAGLFLLLVGFVFDVLFGNPSQGDHAPETLARFARHIDVVAALFWLGAGIFCFGFGFAIIRSKRPVWAFVSVLVPFIGVLFGLDIFSIADPDAATHMGLLRIYQGIGIMLLAWVAGVVAALTALARRERYWALAVTGLILNSGPILYLFIFRGH
jgi:hypothetical protein